MINPTAHADAILAWMEGQFGTVSRDELRGRIEQEVRDVARRAYDDSTDVADAELGDWGDGGETLRSGQRLTVFLMERSDAIMQGIRALKAGL